MFFSTEKRSHVHTILERQWTVGGWPELKLVPAVLYFILHPTSHCWHVFVSCTYVEQNLYCSVTKSTLLPVHATYIYIAYLHLHNVRIYIYNMHCMCHFFLYII